VAELVHKLSGRYDVVLLDCLTLWLSNVMAHTDGDDEVLRQSGLLVEAVRNVKGTCIIVSNEVGLGIVPDNALARRFRDLAGFVNQQMAQASDEAYLLTSGMPLKIK